MEKAGIVLLVGRPSVGKSTLLNNLLGRKVAITSPKPQTTRFPIHAVFEDERGQIVFVDTPGIMGKVDDILSRSINTNSESAISQEADLILYLIDHNRPRDHEENRVLGIVRKTKYPKLLVINKIDRKRADFSADYAFYEREFTDFVKVSALKRTNFNILLDKIFAYLPNRKPLVTTNQLVQPALNLDSKLFIAEIIREKVFLNMREEVPYTVTTKIEQVEERPDGTLYIKGNIVTTRDRYKVMLIGHGGVMIKEIGMAVRKELEAASDKKVYVDLLVEVNPRWQEEWINSNKDIR